MLFANLSSSNPALNDDAFNPYAYGGEDRAAAKPATATLQGVVNKTGLLVMIAVAGGGFGYWISAQMPSVMWISAIASMVIALGIFFVLRGNPGHAIFLAPVYAVVEGVFLGSLTGMLDRWLASMDIAVPGGLALQAFLITLGVTIAMLVLYSMRIIRPTKRFTAIITTATAGIMLTYAASWVLAIFGMQIPFLNLGSAVAGGTAGWIGLGLNVLILGVAAMWLIIDFKLVEDHVNAGAEKRLEWYCGFALLVTLAWIYYEAVKLAFRLAILFAGRE